MEQLLNNITWKQYISTSIAAMVIYYAFISWKHYRSEIRKVINRVTGKTKNMPELPSAFEYQEAPVIQSGETFEPTVNEPMAYAQQPAFVGTAGDLAWQLRQCIGEATDEPFAPAELIPKLQKILNDYPDVAATKDREKINALVVSECENTGTALLSESEVDLWWSA